MIDEILQKQAEFHKVNHGVIHDPVDERDYKAEELMGDNLSAAVVPSFAQGYDALADCWPDMPNQNQEAQFSCTGRAASHYKQVLQAKDTGEHTLLSAKSLYNPVATPHFGAFVRDPMVRTVNYGVNKESTIPSNGTEDQITAPFNFTPYADEAAFYKNITVASVSSQDFDVLAKMIFLNHGFVSGWQTHCQYFKAYGILNGRRFLKTHGSYGPGSDMYFFENSGETLFSAWTAVDQKNIQNPPKPDSTKQDLFKQNIYFGDKGVMVLKLRSVLNKLGWQNNTANILYDRELADVVKNFQLANLKRAPNVQRFLEVIFNLRGKIVGPATIARLNELANLWQ